MRCSHPKGHPLGFTCPDLDAAVRAGNAAPARPLCACGRRHYKPDVAALCLKAATADVGRKPRRRAMKIAPEDAVGGTIA